MPPYAAGSIASYSNVFAAYSEEMEDAHAEKMVTHKLPTREDFAEKKVVNEKQKLFRVSGEHKLRTLMYIMNNCFKWILNRFQRRFIANIVQALAPYVVGNDWDAIGPALCKEFGWARVVMQTIATAPRRMGKTVSVSISQTAVAMIMEGSKQATFSTGKRASGNLRDAVVKNIIDSGYAKLIASRGLKQERMEVHPVFGDPNNRSQLDFLPKNSEISVICVYLCDL